MSDTDRLLASGWKRTNSGRWIHPDAPPLADNRRRLFTEAEALTLLNAETADPEPIRLSSDGQSVWDEWCNLITKDPS